MVPEPFELDVRPALAAGREPFLQIMEAVDNLRPGQALRLLAPFRPYPLFQVMERRGFACLAKEIEGGDWEVTFSPPNTRDLRISVNARSPESWPHPIHSVDLSALSLIEAVERVLDIVQTSGHDDVIFALFPREPLHLFPQLDEHGQQWVGQHDHESGHYRLLVRVQRL